MSFTFNKENIRSKSFDSSIKFIKNRIKKASKEGETEKIIKFNEEFENEILAWLEKRNFEHNGPKSCYTGKANKKKLKVYWTK